MKIWVWKTLVWRENPFWGVIQRKSKLRNNLFAFWERLRGWEYVRFSQRLVCVISDRRAWSWNVFPQLSHVREELVQIAHHSNPLGTNPISLHLLRCSDRPFSQLFLHSNHSHNYLSGRIRVHLNVALVSEFDSWIGRRLELHFHNTLAPTPLLRSPRQIHWFAREGWNDEWLFWWRDRTHLALATRHGDVHESPRICNSLLGAALGGFLLFLRFDLCKSIFWAGSPLVRVPRAICLWVSWSWTCESDERGKRPSVTSK